MAVTQDRVACPFTWTVHAPQSPTPHPNFDPVSPKTSRRYQSSGISGSPPKDCSTPFTLSSIIFLLSLTAYAKEINFTQLHQLPAKSAPDHVRPLPLEPRCARFSICRITAEKSCSAPSSNCLALISKAAPVAGIRAPTVDARSRINPKSLFISRIGNCGL